MKVRQQRVHDFEIGTPENEDVCFTSMNI